LSLVVLCYACAVNPEANGVEYTLTSDRSDCEVCGDDAMRCPDGTHPDCHCAEQPGFDPDGGQHVDGCPGIES
jgi:hypothetical protein